MTRRGGTRVGMLVAATFQRGLRRWPVEPDKTVMGPEFRSGSYKVTARPASTKGWLPDRRQI